MPLLCRRESRDVLAVFPRHVAHGYNEPLSSDALAELRAAFDTRLATHENGPQETDLGLDWRDATAAPFVRRVLQDETLLAAAWIFFIVVLLAATVNIRLATLLPWTQERDRW